MRFYITAVALFASCPLFAQPTFTVDIKDAVKGTSQSDLVCKVTAGNEDIKSGNLVIVAPSNFSSDPQTIVLPGVPAKQTITRISRLKANDAKQPTAGHEVIVELSASTTSAAAMVVGSQSAHFNYINGCLDIACYLLWGSVGALLGYLIRLIIAHQQGTTPPLVAITLDETPTPAEKYHYLLDGALTLLLSFIVLVYLINNGRPPDSACTWYGSIVAGVALGFLSNAQLMSKVTIPTRGLTMLRTIKAENAEMRARMR